MELTYKVPPFPTHIFPGDVRNFIQEAARSLSCPEDFIGVLALTVMSSAIGTSRCIEVKKGWIEPAVIYACIVAPPASKKSPAYKVSMKPVYSKQKEEKKEYDKLLSEYNNDLEKWELDKKQHPKPIKPILKRNVINDFTIEALLKILSFNKRGVLLALDEIAGWIKSMDQYRSNKGADKEKWLSLWTCSPIISDRSSREEPLIVDKPFVSVIGGIQPERLHLLKSKEQDGFIPRILFSFPENIKDRWEEDGVPEQIAENFQKRYNLLRNLEFSGNGKELESMLLKFTRKAKEAFIKFFNVNLEDIGSDPNSHLKVAYKKLEAYNARFALIFQLLFDHESTVVELESVEAAVILAEYFKAHCRKVYAEIENRKIDNALIRAFEAIKAVGGKITAREFYTKRIAKCKDAKSTNAMFERLQKAGYGTIEKAQASSGGKPTIVFQLHNYV